MKKGFEFREEGHEYFPGYGLHDVPGHFFKYPMILEEYWYTMTGAEQKVLTFILRKTYGWQKQKDKISLSQFVSGDGTGNGTGLSRSQVKRAINSLEERGFINVTRINRQPSYFELPLNDEALQIEKEKKAKMDDFNARAYEAILNYQYKTEVNKYNNTEFRKP